MDSFKNKSIKEISERSNGKFCQNYLVWHKSSVEDMYEIDGQSDGSHERLEWGLEAYWQGREKGKRRKEEKDKRRRDEKNS